jgi:hypothetical protein
VPTATSEFMSGARAAGGHAFLKEAARAAQHTTAVSANWMYQLFCVPMVPAIQW